MRRKDYEIIGIPKQMAKIMGRDFREDLTIYQDRKTGEIKGKIALTSFQAFMMKRAIKKHNNDHSYVLKLKRIKKGGKHRV